MSKKKKSKELPKIYLCEKEIYEAFNAGLEEAWKIASIIID